MKCVSIIALLCLFFLQPAVLSQGTCDGNLAGPFVIPVRNVTLPSQAVRRGIALSIGTPTQSIAAFANDGINNTLLFDVGDFCASDSTPLQCEVGQGGFFDYGASATWAKASSAAAAGGAPVDSLDAGDFFGSDVLQANVSTQIKQFPLGIQRGSALTGNALGLGLNSTLLNALKSAKIIASHSWALFWGLTGADARSQLDGSLVLGGYDGAKATGPNSTQSITTAQGCNFLVVVTAITMNFPNGTNYNILGTSHGAALRMCISPTYPIITIPYDLWQNFLGWAGGTYIGRSFGENLWGEVFAANGVYNGDLTFTLTSGLSIKVPNNQLVVPDYSVDSSGHRISNATTREVLLNSLQDVNLNDIPLLGRTFLTSAYLYVNYDQSQFTLWQANPTTDQNLVAVGSGPSCPTTPLTPTTSAGSSPSSSGNPSGSPSPTPNPSAPIGAIVGGVCGGAAILGILIGAAYFFRRRSRRADAAMAYGPEQHELQSVYKDQYKSPAAQDPLELPAVEPTMELGQGMRHEMDGRGIR